MGNRVFVFLESNDFPNPISIYGHWAGEEIYQPVIDILSTTDRIGDSAYLTAQIIKSVFDSLEYDGKASFGVSSVTDPFEAALWADNPSLTVNLDNGYYRIGENAYDRFGNYQPE